MNHTTRGFYQFNTSALAGKVIKKAVMNVTQVWSPSCTARPVSAWVTGGINSGTTWNAQPGFLQKASTVTTAKGNSTACPAGGVGFDMGTTTGWLKNSPQWTVALRADNESDSLGWKRFANSADLIITYGTPPKTPTIYGITDGYWVGTPGGAGVPYVTRRNMPAYSVRSGDVDGGTLSVDMFIRNSAGTIVASGNTGPGSAAVGTIHGWQGPKLADGAYTLQAVAKDPTGLKSGVMSFKFEITTIQPSPPTITPPAGVFDSTGRDPNGVVGASKYTFTIKDTDVRWRARGYIYAVTSKSKAPTSPPGNLACGGRFAEFVYVGNCAGAASLAPTAAVTISGISEQSQLTVWAVDRAGNVNNNPSYTGFSAAKQFSFTVGRDLKPLATPRLVSVTPNANAEWKTIPVNPGSGKPLTGTCTEGVSGPAGDLAPDEGRVLEIRAGGRAVGSGSAVDASKSFTTTAWVCPSQVGTSVRSIMTQLASPGSPAARLALNPEAKFVLQGWSAQGAVPDQVATTTGVVAGAWNKVVAAYDATNRQLRITFTDSAGILATWVTATSAAAQLVSPPTQAVVLGDSGVVGVDQFVGQIYQPAMVQGILVDDQIEDLRHDFPAGEGVMK